MISLKKIIIIIFIIVSFTNMANANQTPWLNVNWGDSIDQVKGLGINLKYSGKTEASYFITPEEKYTSEVNRKAEFMGIPMKSVEYKFAGGKELYAINISIEESGAYDRLEKTLSDTNGPGQRQNSSMPVTADFRYICWGANGELGGILVSLGGSTKNNACIYSITNMNICRKHTPYPQIYNPLLYLPPISIY